MAFLYCPPEIPPKKSAEQAEDSSPNTSSSACDIRIQKRISRGFAKSFPQKIVLAKPSPHFAPPHCPNTWRAEPQKEKCPFHFRKKSTPAKKQKSKEHFFFLGLPSEARRWWGFRGAYDLVSSHHALRAWHIVSDFGNRCELGTIETHDELSGLHTGEFKRPTDVYGIFQMCRRKTEGA